MKKMRRATCSLALAATVSLALLPSAAWAQDSSVAPVESLAVAEQAGDEAVLAVSEVSGAQAEEKDSQEAQPYFDQVLCELESTSAEYTGAAIAQQVTVHDGERVLAEGLDYAVLYENNVIPGEASVLIEGLGNYAGFEARMSFDIVRSADNRIALPGSWRHNATGWWYAYDDGGYPANCTLEVDGTLYSFDSAGYMYTGWYIVDGAWHYYYSNGVVASGWVFVGGSWYYLDSQTSNMRTGWVNDNGTLYFTNSSGAMQTGWILVDGCWYWAYSSGALASSWQSIGAARYYFDPQTFAMSKGRRDIDGNIYFFGDYGLANGWCNDGADWYYCSDGIACTGWKLVDGAWYYLDPASDGKMSVGYLDLGDAAYYLKPDGAMAVGWALSEGGWYFASQSGALASGWYKEGASWYYLDAFSHLMKTGLFEVGGNDCFADQSGRLVVSSWVAVEDGEERYADDNGYLCKDVIREGGTILKTAGADGWQIASGWVDVANQKCYAEPGSGVIHRGWLQVDGDWYWLDADSGVMKTGWLFTGGSWYYLNADGKMATGWKCLSGTWYHLDPNGSMHVGWLKDSGKWYWLDGSGAMATGARTIDGVRRIFWSDGQCDKVGWQNPPQYPQVSSWTVQLPSYCTGYFTYVTPSRISVEATREDCVEAFIQRAYEYIGTQYIEPWSTAPGGAVDCSGFVLQCLYATGMDMGVYNPYNHRWDPNQTYNSMNWYRSNIFMPVSTSSIQRGDVIYYRGHIAIALGNGMMIDSWPHQGVGIHPIGARGSVIGAARPFI